MDIEKLATSAVEADISKTDINICLLKRKRKTSVLLFLNHCI